MKQFEKWWDKQLCSNDKTLKYIAEITCRAALERIRDNICESANTIIDIKNAIDEELKDGE